MYSFFYTEMKRLRAGDAPITLDIMFALFFETPY